MPDVDQLTTRELLEILIDKMRRMEVQLALLTDRVTKLESTNDRGSTTR